MKINLLIQIYLELKVNYKTHKNVIENCHGVDIFFENPYWIPKMPLSVGNLKLNMISYRRSKVYPGILTDIWLVDHHRFRYIATDENQNLVNISIDEISNLIKQVSTAGIKWMHIEKLQLFDGEFGYFKAHR